MQCSKNNRDRRDVKWKTAGKYGGAEREELRRRFAPCPPGLRCVSAILAALETNPGAQIPPSLFIRLWVAVLLGGSSCVGKMAEREGLLRRFAPCPSGLRCASAILAALETNPGVQIPPSSFSVPRVAVVFGDASSSDKMAEREGFEPPGPCGPAVFKTAAIDHSATSPCFLASNSNPGWQAVGGFRSPENPRRSDSGYRNPSRKSHESALRRGWTNAVQPTMVQDPT